MRRVVCFDRRDWYWRASLKLTSRPAPQPPPPLGAVGLRRCVVRARLYEINFAEASRA
jgi:hypothetical protein